MFRDKIEEIVQKYALDFGNVEAEFTLEETVDKLMEAFEKQIERTFEQWGLTRD